MFDEASAVCGFPHQPSRPTATDLPVADCRQAPAGRHRRWFVLKGAGLIAPKNHDPVLGGTPDLARNPTQVRAPKIDPLMLGVSGMNWTAKSRHGLSHGFAAINAKAGFNPKPRKATQDGGNRYEGADFQEPVHRASPSEG
jgi:hypothetical protein